MDHEDQINRMDTHDITTLAAHNGHAVLKELTFVETNAIPDLTLRNVLRETDTETIIAVLVLTFTYWAGLNALNLPTAQIAFMIKDLGQPEISSWISTASSAGIAVATPTVSGLTDILGRKYALIVGCLFGILGSVLAGTASSLTLIIAGQVFNGIAIALVFIASASVAEIVPAFTRPFWGAICHLLGSIGGVFDPIYAGALVETSIGGWRWIYYINSIFFGLAAIGIVFFYHTKSRTEALGVSKRQTAKEMDYLGLVLLAGGIVSLLLGLSWGGIAAYGWHSTRAITPTVVGGVTLVVALPLWEIYGAKVPFLVLSLFRDRTYNLILVLAFINGFVNLCSTVYLPQIILAFWQANPVKINIDRLPYNGMVAIAVVSSGWMFQVTGRYKWAYCFYACAILVGQGLFTVLQPTTTLAAPLILSAVTGLGVGATTQLSFVVAVFCVPQDKLGLGIGLVNTIRSIGGAVGVAIFNTILNNKNEANLKPAIINAALSAGVPESKLAAILKSYTVPAKLLVAVGGNHSVATKITTAVLDTEMNSYRIVFFAIIPFGVVAVICTLFLREVTHYMSNETVFGVDHHTSTTNAHNSEKVALEADENAIHVEHVAKAW